MGSLPRFGAIFAVLTATACVATSVEAQYFGRNKVHYDKVEYFVLSTKHFDLYHAHEDLAAARLVARLAERWYARLSRLFEHELSDRQPIVLYSNHRQFEQTNIVAGLVDETTGGLTESRRRRIALPFAASLAETDHVLGHEIVHAFQYDMSARHRTTMALPLWFLEGMAEYASLGPDDRLTAMWMRDAVDRDELPAVEDLADRALFPYRYGAAFWSYLATRFGPGLPGKLLKTRGSAIKRLERVAGVSADELTTGWHEALRRAYAPENGESRGDGGARRLISRRQGGGRLNLGASLSPDGRRLVFLSERDRFSVDAYLADVRTGHVGRKLITTATNPEFESLQYLNSAGAWDPAGERVAVATIRRGQPVLTILDVDGRGRSLEIPLPQFGEILGPTWSPDGTAIAFSGMKAGTTDLYIVELATRRVRQLTDDLYADLQPAWSPDGRTLALVTDRFSTNLDTLTFGAYQIALIDATLGAIYPAPVMPNAWHIDPAWSTDGASLFLVADPDGISNVYRLDLERSAFFRVTDVATGVSGVTRLSPSLSVAKDAGTLSFTMYRRGAYEIHVIESPAQLAGVPTPEISTTDAHPWGVEIAAAASGPSPPEGRPNATGAPPENETVRLSTYRPVLSLEAIGTPYMAAGGGSFGSYLRAGTSFVFGDLLGNRRVFTDIELSNRLGDSAVRALYVDRDSRWNWGAVIDQVPEIRMSRRAELGETVAATTLIREYERLRRTHRRVGVFLAYPFNRSERVELNAGIRHVSFDRQLDRRVFVVPGGRLLEEGRADLPARASVLLAEAGVAIVRDNALFGATGPVLGSRFRFQVTPSFGTLTYARVLADYRRYIVPVQPYTVALRLFHTGRYGRDAYDSRLSEWFLASSRLLRGYSSRAISRLACQAERSACDELDRLTGNRLLVGNLELRFPLLGPMGRLSYGMLLPVDALLFADLGAVWGDPAADRSRMATLRSLGAGVRVNARGMIFELAAVRPIDLAERGWTFALNLHPGF